MDELVPFVIMVGGLVAVLGFFVRLAVRVRSRGLAGGAVNAALASYEEAFRATSHAAHVEIQVQTERKAPLLAPDDHWDRSEGRVGTPGTRTRRAPVTRPGRPRGALRRWAGRFGADRRS